MSPRSVNAKHSPKKPNREVKAPDQILIIRLVAAAVLLAVACIVKMPAILRQVLIVLSMAASGYDVAMAAIDSVVEGEYFSDSLLILLIAILSLPFGFGAEGAAMLLIYQASKPLYKLIVKLTKRSGMQLLSGCDADSVALVEETLNNPDSLKLSMGPEIKKSSTITLRAAMLAAVIYAIVLPLISGFTYRVSIHRALMMLAACIPGSVIASLPLTAMIGLCHSAGKGVLFNKASSMEDLAGANLAVIDKAGVFSAGEPELLSVHSAVESLDDEAFMNMAAHACYYSEQPFAKAITAKADPEYRLDVLSDFEELPGGVKVNIGSSSILLANAETFAEYGIEVPADLNDRGQVYYMTLAGRYIGKILLSSEIDPNAASLVEALKEEGIKRSILVTEDPSAESQKIAEKLGLSESYGECDTERKLKLIDDLSQGPRNKILFLYSNGIERHSAAKVDMRISKKAKFADVTVQPQNRDMIPASVRISKRMLEVAKENSIFVFAVKALLIFLSMIGYSKIWFVLFVDTAASMGSMLNAIRVTRESLFKKILKK